MANDTDEIKAGLPPRPSTWLLIGSYITITLALLWTGMCLYVILDVRNASPYAFFGAVIFGPFGVVYAIMQYRAVFARRRQIAEFNGIGLILFGALGVFGVVTTIGEAMMEDDTFKLNLTVLAVSLVILLLFAVAPVCLGVSTFRWGRALYRYEKTTPLCKECGYNLYGTLASHSTKCPECGHAISDMTP